MGPAQEQQNLICKDHDKLSEYYNIQLQGGEPVHEYKGVIPGLCACQMLTCTNFSVLAGLASDQYSGGARLYVFKIFWLLSLVVPFATLCVWTTSRMPSREVLAIGLAHWQHVCIQLGVTCRV